MQQSKQKKNKQDLTFTFIDLFAGIGGFRLALESLKGTCIFSSEWDRDSQTIYELNFGELPFGDITKIKETEIPTHDVLCAGFPCQSFSISGKRLGFNDTRGTLFFEIARVIKYHHPKIIFLENVKNFARHDNGKTLLVVLNTLKELGYKTFYKVLRSSDFGVPQARERIYILGFRNDLGIEEFKFPSPKKSTRTVKNILEPEPAENQLYINRKDINLYGDENNVTDRRRPLQIGKINKGGQGERIYSINSAGITLSAYGGGAASKTGAYLINGRIRKLTPRECARMQGFPETFILPINKNTAYKQFGNSVSVPVIKAIFENVLTSYNLYELPKEFLTSASNKSPKQLDFGLING